MTRQKGAKIIESVFEFKAYNLDVVDFLRLLLTNSGDNEKLGAALFGADTEYTQFGASYSMTDGCYMMVKNQWTDPPTDTNDCDVVLVVIAADDKFKNKKNVPTCQPSIDFGGGICNPDPSTQTQKFYEALLDMREHAYTSFKPLIKEIRDACASEDGVFAWNGEDETACPEGYAKKAQKAFDKIDSTMDNLGHLDWTPGLYVAAREGAKVLKNQKKEIID